MHQGCHHKPESGLNVEDKEKDAFWVWLNIGGLNYRIKKGISYSTLEFVISGGDTSVFHEKIHDLPLITTTPTCVF